MNNFFRNKQGMSLAVMIALGFAAAVVVVFLIGLIAYFVNS